jgi:hypothetical protein
MAAGPEAVVRGHRRAAALVIPAGRGFNGGKRGSVDCNRHTLSRGALLAVRLPRPQRQLVSPRGKAGRVHGELSQLICDRPIKDLAVLYTGAWCSGASDNCVTRWPNECNIEGRDNLIAAAQRTNANCGRHHERVGSLISNAHRRRRNCRRRGDCVPGLHWRVPFARETGDKCSTGCCSKPEKHEGCSACPHGGHGTQPMAKSLARQHPKIMVHPSVSVIKSAHPDPCSLRTRRKLTKSAADAPGRDNQDGFNDFGS